jgi:hypothetical protein
MTNVSDPNDPNDGLTPLEKVLEPEPRTVECLDGAAGAPGFCTRITRSEADDATGKFEKSSDAIVEATESAAITPPTIECNDRCAGWICQGCGTRLCAEHSAWNGDPEHPLCRGCGGVA